ncbi:hypothetical protein C8N40_110137 [Pontibacter mucosus]|uniref:Uncharacterized protein n=1 Tax=Pontibacter mucosus TaxID=1649266 RepID=A0A2T5YDW3_9BACT|nr:hypothetical protein [Pontibacter mucosus]PTX14708.1 hypothetical protein C8N40_110137 [Pontibacter mucosus]
MADQLTPQFDVLPHGIVVKGNKVFAAFKMVVSFLELSGGIADLTDAVWSKAVKLVNEQKWQYQVAPQGIDFRLFIRPIQSNTLDSDYQRLLFLIKQNGGEPKESESFHLGYRLTQNRMKNSFDFFKGASFFIPNPPATAATKPIIQFEYPTGSAAAGRPVDYGRFFSEARTFSNSLNVQGATSNAYNKLNFSAVYASLLDEPLAAEVQYGLIREFLIEMGQFPDKEGDTLYDIYCNGIQTNKSFVLQKKIIGGKAKYYHGLSKRFFTALDFDSVRYETEDPYKKQLEQKHLHPDGIYIIAVYKEDSNGIKDPFNAPETPEIKGFNTLVRYRYNKKDLIYSLSLHDKLLTFPNAGSLTKKSQSGYLAARSEMHIKNAAVRNNVLLSWRGDHLIVNRVAGTQQQDIDKETEQKGGDMKTEVDYCAEDQFVQKNLMKGKETLAVGSQAQLLSGISYEFLFRSVSSTHHYFPYKAEVAPPDAESTLTVEDIVVEATPLLSPIDFSVHQVEKIPIASPSIIGRRNYTGNTETVDQHNHLVLLKTASNTTEWRYIYPPQIKRENFRIMGGQTVEALTQTHLREEKVTLPNFVTRCQRLDHRMQQKIYRLHIPGVPIPYLADLRGKDLYIMPSDFFTSMYIKPGKVPAYIYRNNYPFYDQTEPVTLQAKAIGSVNQIVFTGHSGNKLVFDKLYDGIYNFDVYVVDDSFSASAPNLMKYNAAPVRVSIVNKPVPPNLKGNPTTDIIRSDNSSIRNFWYFPIAAAKETHSWKSIKYLEENMVLQLRHENVDELLNQQYESSFRSTLLRKEYPYELFLTQQSSIDVRKRSGLFPYIYPEQLMLKYSIPTKLSGSGIFFQLKLNEQSTLEAFYDQTAGGSLRLGDEEVKGNEFTLQIIFEPSEHCYYVVKDGTRWQKLSQLIHPELSVVDLQLPPEVLPFVVLDGTGNISLERSGRYIFIANLGHPYACIKRVKLFGSSIFQAYFPGASTEYDIGTEGTIFSLAIPNNSQPTAPKVDVDILLKHQIDLGWSEPRSVNLKENITESLVRLTVQEDFMTEGKNQLGIVLSKVNAVAGDKDPYVSRIGEDITKLTSTDWSNDTLRSLLDLSEKDPALNKYFTDKLLYCQINQGVYEVLRCTPYYNTELRKWQVVLPLKFFQGSEVMFLKLVCLKIAPGKNPPTGNYTPHNPFKDTTGTNLSSFSDAVQLPVYTRKIIRVTRKKQGGRTTFTIRVNSKSRHIKKIYFLMMLKENPTGFLLNLKDSTHIDKLSSLVSFTVVPSAEGTPKKGKILAFNSTEDVTVYREDCYSLLVLECEIHDNAGNLPTHKSFDVPENPFFEMKGVRVINLAEFKVN